MTHTITNTERENAGSKERVVATVDITSLDSAGVEQFDAKAELGVSGQTRFGVGVRGAEDPTVQVKYDHVNDQLDVINVADGSDVANNTDVGEVVLDALGE